MLKIFVILPHFNCCIYLEIFVFNKNAGLKTKINLNLYYYLIDPITNKIKK